jgi:methylated-DNA-protein-cysteine methyltransferase related protein
MPSKLTAKQRSHSAPVTAAIDNAERILKAVQGIPRGRVSTYGAVAEVAGLPRRARLVGKVLREAPSGRKVPWFRVLNASGRLSFPLGSDAYALQKKTLEREGVIFIGGRVDLKRFGWPATVASLDEYLWSPPEPEARKPRWR